MIHFPIFIIPSSEISTLSVKKFWNVLYRPMVYDISDFWVKRNFDGAQIVLVWETFIVFFLLLSILASVSSQCFLIFLMAFSLITLTESVLTYVNRWFFYLMCPSNTRDWNKFAAIHIVAIISLVRVLKMVKLIKSHKNIIRLLENKCTRWKIGKP